MLPLTKIALLPRQVDSPLDQAVKIWTGAYSDLLAVFCIYSLVVGRS